MQAFYNGVSRLVRSIIDVVVGGTLINKTEDEAYNLIEEMTLNNCQWYNERRQPKRLEVSWSLMLSLCFQLR